MDHLSPGYFRDYRLLLLLPSPSSPSGFRPAASTPSRRIHTYRRKLHFVGCKGSVVKIVTPATLTTLARFEIAPPSINNIAPTLDRPFAKRHSAQRFYAARPFSRDRGERILRRSSPSFSRKNVSNRKERRRAYGRRDFPERESGGGDHTRERVCVPDTAKPCN